MGPNSQGPWFWENGMRFLLFHVFLYHISDQQAVVARRLAAKMMTESE